ncbi:HNH endonuclease signature motif containing protein [Clostridium estertheticum]|uniref:HNH endonuclease n=1 Tax=Clostridium estertheticum TaxID=238834 RepID=A0AA47EIM7_9CLOT|nr:HNH endonuclease signature motif containing protein [Clostridium estertheticum]MBU3153511.1 HNH endonuclease [Clostridium estertheticum]WAG60912.1 HNH endonuclease [Clostridium estertheticum]
MSDFRPPIPEPLKRELRQEAYFGCVICGCPIIEYHHINQYHLVKCHEKTNIVILCPEHHHRANCGEIYKEMVLEYKKNPYNKNNDYVGKEFILKKYNDLKFLIGSMEYYKTPIILRIDKEVLIWVKEDINGIALFNAKFYNKDNKMLAVIRDNEWRAFRSAKLWDVVYSPGHLVIRDKKGSIFMELNTLGEKILLRANMMYNNYEVKMMPQSTAFGRRILKNGGVANCLVGIQVFSKNNENYIIK